MNKVSVFIGKLVKQAREEKQWTRRQLAEEIAMEEDEIEAIENGRDRLGLFSLAKFAYALDISESVMVKLYESEHGVLADHIYRELLRLDVDEIQLVAESAIRMKRGAIGVERHDEKKV